jgi:MFS family permease
MTDISVSKEPAGAYSAGAVAGRGRGGRGGRGAGRGAGRPVRPGVLLAIVLAGQLMAVLDTSVVNVAAPSIHAGLHASGAGLQLIVAGYTISYAVLMVTGARLGDLLGHRAMFLAGLAAFTLASLGCGLAPATGPLVGLRFVQGAAAATMIPQVLSLIQRTFSGPVRARAMRAYSAVLAGGVVLGQVAGGLLISADVAGSTWRPVFLVNVPVGLAVLAAGWWLLPSAGRERARGLDPAGLVLLSLAVLALVVPLVLGQPEQWPAWGWASMAGSVLLAVAFVTAERRLGRRGGAPIVPGSLLRLPGVALGTAAMFVNLALFGGFSFALALQLQSALGESALRAGLTFAPAAAAFGLVSLNWQRLPGRLVRWLPVAGFALAGAGMAATAALLHGGGRGGTLLYLIMVVTGAGMAAAFSPLMTGVLMRVPVSSAADATGVVVTVNQLGIVAGVASFGTVYLNLAGALPAGGPGAGFRLLGAHAGTVTMLALAAAALCGAALAALRERSLGALATPPAPGAPVPSPATSPTHPR